MADCECLAGCPFFQGFLKNMPANAELTKMKYCQGEYTECARYMVFKALGKPRVPDDLFPREKERAEEIIQKG